MLIKTRTVLKTNGKNVQVITVKRKTIVAPTQHLAFAKVA